MTSFLKSPQIQRILLEADALSAALLCAEGKGDREDVLRRIEEVLPGLDTADNPSLLTQAAMCHIARRPLQVTLHPGDSTEQWVFEVIARGWVAWATKLGREEARKALRKIPAPKGPRQEGGALHLMAMQPWASAVDALLQHDRDEARRFFRRATELASQCGLETNPAIQWTYAASYFGK